MQGGLSEEQVETKFMLSTEYAALHPTPSDFVQSLYGNILGRAGSAAEVGPWVTLMTTVASEEGVIGAFRESTEAVDRAVSGLYWSILNGGSDNQAAMYVANLQSGGTLASVAVSIASSNAFVTLANRTVG
jgi:hypothetical protein